MILDKPTSIKYADIFASMYKITKKEEKDKLPLLFRLQKYPTTKTKKEILDKKGDVSNRTEQFKIDLAINQPVEANFVDAYSVHNPCEFATYDLNDDHRFDLRVTYEIQGVKSYTYIELKNEMSAIKWGNLAIEHKSWGKPSGIRTTEANLWVSRVDGFYIVFKTSRLIDALNEKMFREVSGGDSQASDSYLLRIRDIVDYISYIIVDKTASTWIK